MIKIELKTLFSPGKIGNVQIKNRIIRSATYTRSASDDGYVTDNLIKYYIDLAEGGTGLLITGIISIDEIGKAGRGQACLYDDSFIAGQKELVNAVHDYSDVKIAAQLSHAGRQGRNPVGPSAILYQMTKKTTRELSNEEIEDIIRNFANASRRAYESGYDMVQLNAGHGWLLTNFLSPYTNKRTDEYGGSTQNRTKILVDIYNQIRDEVGKSFPIFLKLQTADYVPGGIILEEGKEITKIVIDVGYDAIEPSGGSGDTLLSSGKNYPSIMIKNPEDENYFLQNVKVIKSIMKNRPIILMGGVRTPEIVEKLLKEHTIDFIAMSRPLIYEPDLPNRWKRGDLSPPLCTSCNQCYMTVLSGPVHCPIKKKAERRKKREAKEN
jgi:2,4-dienoyl-CoA reductase-like NADH-dependent reductase (Old Yellow Enzyme family)